MKISSLLELIGSGSILLIVGAAMLCLGVGYGFSEATQLPLWAVFGGLGLLLSIAGIALVDRGTEEAEVQVNEQVKMMPRIIEVVRNPLIGFGAAVLGGIILQRLCRRSGPEVVVNTQPAPVVAVPAVTQTDVQAAPSPAKPSGFSISHYLTEQLGTVASVASGLAITMGLKALGIPSMNQLMSELMTAVEPKEKPAEASESGQPDQGSAAASTDREQPYRRGSPPEWEFAGQPSHNGRNHPGEFDPTAG